MLKGISYIVLFMLLFVSCHKDSTDIRPSSSCNFIDFKYYHDAKDYLGELENNYILVAFDSNYSEIDVRKFISSVNYFDQKYKYTLYNSQLAVLKFSHPKTCEQITDIILDLKKNPIIEYVHYTMKTDDCFDWVWAPLGNLCVNSYSGAFYVQVFDENKLSDLYKMIAETKTEIIEQNQFMPTWFVLKTTKKSQSDALSLANYFFESKLFQTAEPEITKFPVE